MSTMTELEMCRAIARGAEKSPSAFLNNMLVDLRISGVGCAYRSAVNELVYRSPNVWLTDDMVARCHGLPVVIDHPNGKPGTALTTADWQSRCIGTILYAYIAETDDGDGELRGVARIVHVDGIAALLTTECSTSPCVLFEAGAAGEVIQVHTDDGEVPLLIEGVPLLLDHVAILPADGQSSGVGVWDGAGASAPGVDQTNAAALADQVAERM
jgi:colicin import membrane protein